MGDTARASRWGDTVLCRGRALWSWHLMAVAPRDPREILAHRRLLAAAAVPPGSPFPAPCQHWGDKGGSCSWRGAEKGLLEERHCCLPAASLQNLPRLPGTGALGSATASKLWGGVCSLPSASHASFLSSKCGNFITFSDLYLYLNTRSDQQEHFRMKPLITHIK